MLPRRPGIDFALQHTSGNSRVMTRRDSRNLPRSSVVPHLWGNANNKSYSMPSDIRKKMPTPSTIHGGLHNSSKPNTSFSTGTNVPKKRKLDLRKVEDDNSRTQRLQNCLRSKQGVQMDASRLSPSLGLRTPEHTELTTTNAEVTLPS